MPTVKNELQQVLLKIKRDFAIIAVQNEGIEICFDEEERAAARDFFIPLVKVFHREITESSLSLIYLYRQSEQVEQFAKYDGLCNVFRHPLVSAIGLSVEMLHGDWKYSVMVFVHELAHLKYSGDDERFFPYMDELLKRFNDEIGTCIVNDYKESAVRIHFTKESRNA